MDQSDADLRPLATSTAGCWVAASFRVRRHAAPDVVWEAGIAPRSRRAAVHHPRRDVPADGYGIARAAHGHDRIVRSAGDRTFRARLLRLGLSTDDVHGVRDSADRTV